MRELEKAEQVAVDFVYKNEGVSMAKIITQMSSCLGEKLKRPDAEAVINPLVEEGIIRKQHEYGTIRFYEPRRSDDLIRVKWSKSGFDLYEKQRLRA